MTKPAIGAHIELYPYEDNKINIYNRNTHKNYILGEKESKVLSCIDGNRSARELQELCPFYTLDEIEKLLEAFDGIEVFKSKKKFNIFKIRLRLFNPNKILKDNGLFTRLFYYLTLIGCPIFLLFGVAFNLTNGFGLLRESIDTNSIISSYLQFNFIDWLLMLVLSSFSLFLHELSHAVTARFYRVNVPEIGLMLYCFIPVAYTNISCINLLEKPSKRILALSAGTLSNLGQIGLCYFLINLLSPHLAAYFFALIIVNIGTIVFNWFVFLKFDGYYIIEVFLNETNLKENALNRVKQYLALMFSKDKSAFKQFRLQQKQSDDIFLQNSAYLIFSLMSSIYVPIYVVNSVRMFFGR